MGHFPFVHDGILGSEPRTEVVDYKVAVDDNTNEIWATECQFWQPAASATATGGQMVDYVYRILQPYSILLYKSCPAAPERMDLIGLFVQSLTEEQVRAHMFLSLVDDESSIALIRFFVQTILAQEAGGGHALLGHVVAAGHHVPLVDEDGIVDHRGLARLTPARGSRRT